MFWPQAKVETLHVVQEVFCSVLALAQTTLLKLRQDLIQAGAHRTYRLRPSILPRCGEPSTLTEASAYLAQMQLRRFVAQLQAFKVDF